MDYSTYFYLFDRTTKEFIIKQKEKIKYCLFNKSNKIAFAEMVKLEGDDTVYSYIRIYDPDQRQYVQNIKTGKVGIVYLINRMDDNYVIYTIEGNNNPTFIYDYNKNKIVDNDLKPFGSPISYVDSNLIVTTGGPLVANIYDWSTDIKENNQIKEDMILYPNPTNSQITVNISEQYYNGTWDITDLTGNILMKGMILSQKQLLIDVNKLQPQKYFLNIKNYYNVKTYKIVKQ